MLALALGFAAGCTGEEAVPLDEFEATSTVPAPAVTHFLEPDQEMVDLATQQCLDDPDLDEGVIRAVDPANPDEILVDVTIDCDDVR